jgi:tetratricopeptide (TPR) repeat protein
MDIRILKYEEYVKKYPQKAHGYYCLGRLYMIKEQYKTAEGYFQKSLLVDSSHTLSKVGLIEAFMFRKKFLKAVRLFSKYRQDIIMKYIYRVKLVRGISAFYKKSDLFATKSSGLFSTLYLKYTIYFAKELIKKESHNTVLKLFMCMYYLNSGERNPFVIQTFKTCVYWDGLDDVLRWVLVKNLATAGENLFYDDNIAGKFSSIPDPDCSIEYANIIFSTAMVKGNKTKVTGVYNSISKYGMSLSPKTMWTYVHWCKENSYYHHSAYECCKKLIKIGWIDRLVAETMVKTREKYTVKFSNDEERMMKLYGYSRDE